MNILLLVNYKIFLFLEYFHKWLLKTTVYQSSRIITYLIIKKYNFLACDWFKNVLFSTNSLAKLLSDSLLLDSLLSDSLISQSHSKM